MIQNADDLKDQLLEANEKEGPIFKLKKDPRVTPIGQFLRRFSLDEVPQILNVFLGQMSLVGPRPPLPREVAQYQPWHRMRLKGPMGLTGFWQVCGRSDLSFEEMCLLDIFYHRNYSLMLDWRILFRTISVVFFGKGAY